MDIDGLEEQAHAMSMARERKSATPSKVKGACRLCSETTYLCDSHLVPAGFFRLLRSTSITPRDPLLITPSTTFTTSRQISGHLLCVKCEDRFRTNGEDWVLRHCYRIGEGFKLRELVLDAELVDDGEVAKIYSGKSNPHIDCDALVFFAARVFWRAAVHQWHLPGSNPEPSVRLGPYEDLLREYLLGSTQFPKTAAVWVWVSQAARPSRAVTFPHSCRIWDCHAHTFDVPGIRFDLFVGRTIPQFVRLMCALNGLDRPILMSGAPDDVLATRLARLSQTTRLSMALKGRGKWSWSP